MLIELWTAPSNISFPRFGSSLVVLRSSIVCLCFPSLNKQSSPLLRRRRGENVHLKRRSDEDQNWPRMAGGDWSQMAESTAFGWNSFAEHRYRPKISQRYIKGLDRLKVSTVGELIAVCETPEGKELLKNELGIVQGCALLNFVQNVKEERANGRWKTLCFGVQFSITDDT